MAWLPISVGRRAGTAALHRGAGDLPAAYRRWSRLDRSNAEPARHVRCASGGDMRPFFVGWSGRGAVPLQRFLTLMLATLLAGFGALAFALGVTVDDPGGGEFTGDKAI